MRGLSGGQKVKVVVGSACWMHPHMIVLDEPTNYLDRDSLGALAGAIKDFGGGVVIISHAGEFVNSTTTEKWTIGNGRAIVTGETWNQSMVKLSAKEQADETVDAAGNVIKVAKKLTEAEKKKLKKEIVKRNAVGTQALTPDRPHVSRTYGLELTYHHHHHHHLQDRAKRRKRGENGVSDDEDEEDIPDT
jgi:elongation factor 3